MIARFRRRLLSLATLQIGVALGVLIVAVALFAFNAYVNALRSEADSTLAQLQVALRGGSARRDVGIAGDVIQSRYARSDLVIVLFEGGRRVSVFRAHRSDPDVTVATSTRGAVPADPRATGPLVAPILGLATAFGLHYAHGTFRNVAVVVKPNEVALVSTTASFLLPVVLALFFALVAAFLLARVLVQQLIGPLIDVQRALDRFAAGDLSPQPISADMRGELAPLAFAYNGAIAQMELAFAERDAANATIRQFIADAGHQLRTPLTVIRGFIAILRKGELRTPQDRERILDTMNRQSLVMGSLIDKLMLLDQWERGSPARPEPIDVAQFVTDVVAPLAEAQPSRTVDVDAESGLLAAIDPSDLAHAVTNLVDNALKYTPGAVRVVVRAEGTTAVVEVRDDGPGMAAADVAHVFDRFYRGNRRDVDGSGLGLAIAKRAVERAGGSLTLRTEPATGSTFTIRLPRTAVRASAVPLTA